MTPVCEFLYEESLKIEGPIDYLEIGVQEGDSIACVLDNPAVRLAVGIDTWGCGAGGTNRGNPNHIADRFADDLDRLLIISGDSKVVLPGLRHHFKMIFVDGDHSEAGVLADMDNCGPLLQRSGSMFVDDLNHPLHTYINKAASTWAERNRFSFTFVDVGFGVGILRRP